MNTIFSQVKNQKTVEIIENNIEVLSKDVQSIIEKSVTKHEEKMAFLNNHKNIFDNFFELAEKTEVFSTHSDEEVVVSHPMLILGASLLKTFGFDLNNYYSVIEKKREVIKGYGKLAFEVEFLTNILNEKFFAWNRLFSKHNLNFRLLFPEAEKWVTELLTAKNLNSLKSFNYFSDKTASEIHEFEMMFDRYHTPEDFNLAEVDFYNKKIEILKELIKEFPDFTVKNINEKLGLNNPNGIYLVLKNGLNKVLSNSLNDKFESTLKNDCHFTFNHSDEKIYQNSNFFEGFHFLLNVMLKPNQLTSFKKNVYRKNCYNSFQALNDFLEVKFNKNYLTTIKLNKEFSAITFEENQEEKTTILTQKELLAILNGLIQL